MVTFTCLRSDELLLGRLSKVVDQWVSSDGRREGETGLGRDGQRAWASIKVGPKVWLIRKDPGKDWRQEEKETTEDEMVGWHHRLNGHEFESTPGVGDGQGGLACCMHSLGLQSRTWLSSWTALNWTELKVISGQSCHVYLKHCSDCSHRKKSSLCSPLNTCTLFSSLEAKVLFHHLSFFLFP